MKKKEIIKGWMYKGEYLTEDQEKDFPQNYEAFVYIMTYIPDGRMYIGKKNFWGMRKENKEAKRRKKTESNWKSYFSSSNDIKHLVTKETKKDWKREIIYLCKEQKYANYLEVKLQFEYGVLESNQWFNSNINGLWYSHWLDGIEQSVEDYKIKMF